MTISTIIEESESPTPNAYFTKPADLAPETKARSVDINALSSAVKVAFDKVPDLVPLYTDTLAYAVDTGAVNAMVVTLSDNVEALVDGSAFTVKTTYGNTAATTIQVTGSTALGTFNVQRADGSAIVGGEWVAGQFLDLRYNATTGALQLAQLPSNSPTSGLPTTGGTMTGAIKEAKGLDIASAANLNLTAATGNFCHVTGTVTITSITIPVGAEYDLVFDGILTITNGVGLLLPGAANITTAVGDRLSVRGDTAGAIVTSYTRANGTPVNGGMTLLATLTPTAAANVDFLSAFSSTYDNYLIIADGLTNNAGAGTDALLMRLANAGSADSGTKYALAGNAATTVVGTSFGFAGNVLGNGKGISFQAKICNVNDAINLKMAFFDTGFQTAATPQYQFTTYGGAYDSANAVSGFRLYWAAGANFGATGKVRVYGYNNT